MPDVPNIVYTVAPRPYMSGTMASVIEYQTPLKFMPSLEDAEGMSFEERIKAGFDLSLSDGLDFFFGLSMVLVAVGDKFTESSGKTNLLPLLRRPRALARLIRGVIRSKLAGRHLLPKDLWKVRGIIRRVWIYCRSSAASGIANDSSLKWRTPRYSCPLSAAKGL
jgi:hypothetical protein